MIESTIGIWIIVGLIVLATMLLMGMVAALYRKAGPHQALVAYGFRGTRVVKGHGTIIFPMIENCRELSLQLMSFDVARSRTSTRNKELRSPSKRWHRSKSNPIPSPS